MGGTAEVGTCCPSCAGPVPVEARFCGHCGALVRPRDPGGREDVAQDATADATEDVPRDAATDALPDVPGDVPEDEGRPTASRVRRRRAAVLAVLLGTVALVVSAVLAPDPEVVTADGSAGPDGTGRTSTRAAASTLAPRWDTRWRGPSSRTPRLTGAFDLGRVFVVATGGELIGLMHPDGIAARQPRDGVNLGGTLDPVLWRLPAVEGTPVLVGGRLPVLADAELLWLSPGDGRILARHELTGAGPPPRWSPSFAVPAGDHLVGPDGTGVLTADGRLLWRGEQPGRVVGVAGDTLVVQHGRSLTGRSVGDGEVRWSERIAAAGHVSARVVDGVVVTTSRGGNIRVLAPDTGATVAERAGPVPANARPTDGETSIIGATETDVFVRVHASYGIRYVRVTARDATDVEHFDTLADRDVRSIQEHGGDLLTLLWDGVEARRHGAVGWAIAVLQRPPAAPTGWVVFGEGEFTITSTDAPTSFRVPHALVVTEARPAVLRGHAVLVTPDGLESRELATGDRAWRVDLREVSCCPSHLVDRSGIALTGPRPRVVDPDGDVRWRDTRPATVETSASVTAVVAGWAIVDGQGSRSRVTLRAMADGRPGPDLDVDRLAGVVSDGSLLHGLADGPTGAAAVVAYDVPPADAGRGTLAARWEVPAAGHVQLVRTGDELLVIGAASVLHLDPATGAVRRRTALPSLGMAPAAVADARIVRRVDARTLESIDLGTGERWTRTFELPLATAPTIAGDVVYVGDAASVVSGLSLADGSTVASVTVPGGDVTSLAVVDGHLLAGSADRLHVLGPPEGAS